tara:strand:+ start:6736 stop:7401 length:666 start_codon:yes stop_codon:yes gene_type:complete
MTSNLPLLLASILTASALLASAPSAASASTLALAAPPEAPIPKRLEFDVGMLVGGLNMGTTHADATGLAVNAGMRLGEVSILGELNYFGIQGAERGTMTRVGLTTRYSLVPLGDPKSFATSDLWLEGGIGWEHVAWRSGGVLDRPDLALGFGWQSNFVMDKHSDHPRYLGPYFALRTLIGQGPATNEEATCGGPCDRATAPSTTDVSFMFHVGINWGRMSF